MRPTSPELLDAIAQALEGQVLPEVQDKWAASTVRSAVQLLRHLAIRVPREPQLLAQDDADVCEVLAGVRASLATLGQTELEALVAAALALPAADVLDTAAVAARNERCQHAVEAVIAARDRLRAAGAPAALHAGLVAYLQRRLARERELYLPVLLTPPV